jgi:predicted RNA binding protein YcfA (HicA-like mRNA interferase family)
MSRKFNINLGFKELKSLVEKKEWKFQRISGSHHIYAKSGRKDKVIIPYHRGDIAPGTVRQIIEQIERY